MVTREQILEWMRADATELPEVEFKLQPPPQRNKIVKAVAALANWGGGYIIFGVGDRKDDAGNRKRMRVTFAAQSTVDWFEQTIGDIRSQIKPFTEVNRYEVQMEEDWSVVVLEVPPPRDLYVRVYQDKPYTRTTKPETVVMKPEQIWEFHRQKLRSGIEERLYSLQPPLLMCLAEMAFRMYERGVTGLREDDARSLVLKHGGTESEALWETARTHHTTRWSESFKEISFISRAMRDLYAALYLNQLPDRVLANYLVNPEWHDVILILASVSGAHQLEFMVRNLFEQDEPLLALRCFLARNWGILVDTRLRNEILDFVVSVLAEAKGGPFLRALVLELVRKELLNDPDDFLRMQVLQSLAGTRLPTSFLITSLRRLDPDCEHNEHMRYQVARVFAEGKVPSTGREEVAEGLIEALGHSDQDFRTFEAILVAVAHLADGMAGSLSESSLAILSGALRRYKIESEKPSRRVTQALKRLEQLIAESVAS